MPKDVEKVDLKKPQEMAYVFSGAYTPISCRIVEQVCVLSTYRDKWPLNNYCLSLDFFHLLRDNLYR